MCPAFLRVDCAADTVTQSDSAGSDPQPSSDSPPTSSLLSESPLVHRMMKMTGAEETADEGAAEEPREPAENNEEAEENKEEAESEITKLRAKVKALQEENKGLKYLLAVCLTFSPPRFFFIYFLVLAKRFA